MAKVMHRIEHEDLTLKLYITYKLYMDGSESRHCWITAVESPSLPVAIFISGPLTHDHKKGSYFLRYKKYTN